MVFYVFPFEIIPQNSKIVLYASGISGRQYYSQITKTDYCKIVLWLDKYPDGVYVKNPVAIMELNETDYDFVVIAISSIPVAEEIRELLVGFGVPECKIVHKNHSFEVPITLKTSLLTTYGFLYEPGFAEKELINYFYESEGELSYFNPLIEDIRHSLNSVDKAGRLRTKELIEEKALEIIKGNALASEAKIVLLYILFVAGAFSKKLTRELVYLATKIQDNMSLKYWLITDLERIWFIQPDNLYDHYFVDMKALRCDYAKNLCLNWNPPAYNKVNNVNVCVILYAAVNPTLQYVSTILRSICETGHNYKFHIIELSPNSNDSSMGIIRFTLPLVRINEQSKTTRTELLPYFPADMEFYRISSAMTKDRLQGILDLICKIEPLCIFDFSDEHSSISYYYSQSYPTIYFPNRKQGFTGSTFYHKYVVMEGKEAIEIHPPITEEQVLRLPVLYERVEPLREFHRKEFGLSNGDTVVITVGNRLTYEISNELAEQMCQLIRQNRSIKWIIVGCSELSFVKSKHEDLIGTYIIFIQYETDLPGLYKICDIYLNPVRTGGGFSIVWAMQQGLALVSSLCESDIETRSLGSNSYLPSEDDLVPYIVRLAEDRELLKQEKELSSKIALEWDWDNGIDCFIDKLIDGIDRLTNDFIHEASQI